MAEEEH